MILTKKIHNCTRKCNMISLTLKTKRIICTTSIFILFSFIFCPLSYGNDEKHINEIKNKLQLLMEAKRLLLEDIPHIEKYKLNREIFSDLSNHFRNVDLLNNYVKTLSKEEMNKFRIVEQLSAKEGIKDSLEQPDVKEIFKIVKNKYWDDKTHEQLINCFKMSLELEYTKEDKLKHEALINDLKISAKILDYLKIRSRFDGSYNFYDMTLRMFNFTIREKSDEMYRLLNELKNSKTGESDKKVQKEIEDFIKKSQGALSTPSVVIPNIGTRNYLYIKYFAECMQSTEKKDAIKKVLQGSKLMREAVISVVLGSLDSNAKETEMIVGAGKLDYDNFDSYWSRLEEISKGLTENFIPVIKQKFRDPNLCDFLVAQFFYFLFGW